MNAGQKLVELSGLSGVSALDHLLAITQGSGTGPAKTVFASQMVVCIDAPTIVVTQRVAEHAITTLHSATETTQQDKPNRIASVSRPARVDVVTRQAALFVTQKAHAATFVRTLPNTINTNTRRKRIVKQIS